MYELSLAGVTPGLWEGEQGGMKTERAKRLADLSHGGLMSMLSAHIKPR